MNSLNSPMTGTGIIICFFGLMLSPALAIAGLVLSLSSKPPYSAVAWTGTALSALPGIVFIFGSARH